MHPDTAFADDILTPRLRLRRMDRAFLDACLRGNAADMRAGLGTEVPHDWSTQQEIIAVFWQRLGEQADFAPFAPRAMLRRSDLAMLGHVGCHTAPNPEYLREVVGEGVEIGYTVFAPYRRQGIAEEAVRGLVRWLYDAHGVRRIVASIAPGNVASQALAAKLGFGKVGEHIDPEDGPEDVLAWVLAPGAFDAAMNTPRA